MILNQTLNIFKTFHSRFSLKNNKKAKPNDRIQGIKRFLEGYKFLVEGIHQLTIYPIRKAIVSIAHWTRYLKIKKDGAC